MKTSPLAFLFVAALLCSCASMPLIGELSPQAARQQARRDFAAGAPKIYRAGGRASFEPGITETQRHLVAGLPRDSSLVGCTNPRVQYSAAFATAYNQEIISLLTKR